MSTKEDREKMAADKRWRRQLGLPPDPPKLPAIKKARKPLPGQRDLPTKD